uniref:Elongation factor G-like domain-containing protein n=1 Tax=Emiliania huxleyi TaxID=2903 RepID=A0A7S3SYJ8_EMIHU
MGKGLGILSTVLVQRGALRQGDHVVAGQSWGKVRLLLDEEGAQLSEAGPAVPVRVSGMREMPRAGDELLVVGPSVSRLSPPCNGASYIGDEMLVVPSEARAKEVVEFRLLRAEAQALAAAAPRRGRKGGGAKLLPALLKAESFGSLEAAREGLSHFPSTRVELKLVAGEGGAGRHPSPTSTVPKPTPLGAGGGGAGHRVGRAAGAERRRAGGRLRSLAAASRVAHADQRWSRR